MPTYRATYIVSEYGYADIIADNDEEGLEKAKDMDIVPGSWETGDEICARNGTDWVFSNLENEDGEDIE